MKHLDSFSNFSKSGISIPYEDPNFWIIYESLIFNQLSHQEKLKLSNDFFINESWFSDLKDKASRGVLKGYI